MVRVRCDGGVVRVRCDGGMDNMCHTHFQFLQQVVQNVLKAKDICEATKRTAVMSQR